MEISFIHMQIWVYLHVNKTNFHLKGFTLGLVLKERRKATQKWPIHTTCFFVQTLMRKFKLICVGIEWVKFCHWGYLWSDVVVEHCCHFPVSRKSLLTSYPKQVETPACSVSSEYKEWKPTVSGTAISYISYIKWTTALGLNC